MSNNNNELALIIEEASKETGEVIHLLPTLRQTIQPKVLLRLGVFVPTLKSTEKGGGERITVLMRPSRCRVYPL